MTPDKARKSRNCARGEPSIPIPVWFPRVLTLTMSATTDSLVAVSFLTGYPLGTLQAFDFWSRHKDKDEPHDPSSEQKNLLVLSSNALPVSPATKQTAFEVFANNLSPNQPSSSASSWPMDRTFPKARRHHLGRLMPATMEMEESIKGREELRQTRTISLHLITVSPGTSARFKF